METGFVFGLLSILVCAYCVIAYLSLLTRVMSEASDLMGKHMSCDCCLRNLPRANAPSVIPMTTATLPREFENGSQLEDSNTFSETLQSQISMSHVGLIDKFEKIKVKL